jgi:hypothetical protein
MKVNYPSFEEQLEILLAQDVINEWKQLGAGHYRICNRLDIWPRRQKFHSLRSGKRGTYYDLEDFLTGYFRPHF